MKSRIIYNDNTFVDNIIRKIENRLANNVYFLRRKKLFYDMLLYSKFVIEKNKLNIQAILDGDVDELIKFFEGKIDKKIIDVFINYKIYEILKLMLFEDYRINVCMDRVLDKFIEKEKKYLFIGISAQYISYENVDILFDRRINLFQNKLWKFRDEIIGVNRKYYLQNEEIVEKYDSIIVYNEISSRQDNYYISRIKSICDSFEDNNILIVTGYDKISNFDYDFGFGLRNIKKVMIDKNDSYVQYSPIKNEVINIQNISDVSDEDLKSVISTTENIEDVSINVSVDEIRKNCSRIGFSVYNKKKLKQNDKHVLHLIDENRIMSNRIKYLDNIISKNMDNFKIK